ncbi:MAG: hypothetical protein ABI675_04945 [Chitinophagaceae bacterium]
MKKILLVVIIFSVCLISGRPLDQFPGAAISNGLIKARLYLPDTKDGYYRGARFDWSGVIPELEYKGHSYFGQWFEKYNPTFHDAIMGPVEDFNPVGYDEAKTGEAFLKVGIGMIVKPEEPKYFFVNPYQIVNPGEWKIKKKPTRVEFRQTLNDKDYSYRYQKTVELIKGKPEMVLSHSLKNTGKRIIESNVYNHNFFVIDKQLTSQDFVLKFPFKPMGETNGKVNFGKLEDNQIQFLRDLSPNEHLQYQSLTGFGSKAKDYDISIENHKTGAAVRITCDQPLSKLAFWSALKTICPEPFIHIKINPGETFTWKISYQFYTCDITNQ